MSDSSCRCVPALQCVAICILQRRGKKVLVLDPRISGFLGQLAEVSLLKEHGVEQCAPCRTSCQHACVPADMHVFLGHDSACLRCLCQVARTTLVKAWHGVLLRPVPSAKVFCARAAGCCTWGGSRWGSWG